MPMGEDPARAIRLLIVEDVKADAERALYQLGRAGLDCAWRRVETEQELVAALAEFEPTVILSDFSLPQFDGTPALRRAIHEAAARLERQKQQEQISRLNRVLRMLSGVNGLVLRLRDRTELLRETCRLATTVGGYTAAVAAAGTSASALLQPVAWSGSDERVLEKLRGYVAESAARESGVIGTVIGTGREFVCNNTATRSATARFDSLMLQAGLLSVVVLPLMVDNTAIAVLVLTARDCDVVGDEELDMLREVAGNLSFGLQYLQRDTHARFLSHFDPQTGLAKRPLFCERVQRMVTAPESQRERLAVVVMDIERLSIINDSFGRRTGD